MGKLPQHHQIPFISSLANQCCAQCSLNTAYWRYCSHRRVMERLQINSQKLDGLPIEIIQRIATFCDCISVFELSKTNKILYEACNDRQVFKVIIENRNGYDGPVWDSIPITSESSRDVWARWALADLKGRQWLHDQWLGTSIQQQRFLSWAPLLMTRSR